MAKNPMFLFLLLFFQISLLVRGQEIPPPIEPLPHEYVRLLGDQVDTLVAQEVLTRAKGTALNTKLSQAKAELNQGGAMAAIRHLERFRLQADRLVQRGVLTSIQGLPLINGATAAQARIQMLAFAPRSVRPGLPSPTGCAERSPCEYATYYVNASSSFRGTPDGSPEAPFRTIRAALERGADFNLCGVDIQIANGRYAGNLVISRGTRIHGESREAVIIIGSILNNGGHELGVQNLTISSSAAPGAIVTDAPCASTTVTRVLILRAQRYGIYQRGGTLTVFSSEILRTRALEDAPQAGTGIYLTGGVQATLGIVDIDNSEAAGLIVEGGQTRVYAAAVAVTRSHVNAYFREEVEALGPAATFAAVEAQHGALLLMDFCTIRDNELMGLRVRDVARAHFRYGSVSHTQQLLADSTLLSINVYALDATTTVELSHFTVSHADTIGLRIQDAYATASDGEISHHGLGVALDPPDDDPNYDLDTAAHCLEEVTYLHNGFNFDSAHLPVQCGGGFFPPCLGSCHTVPFSCEWCR